MAFVFNYKIIDSSLKLIVGPLPSDSYEKEDVIFFRDCHGMAFTGSIIDRTTKYGNLNKTLPDYKQVSPRTWRRMYKKLGSSKLSKMRANIKEKRQYAEFMAEKAKRK